MAELKARLARVDTYVTSDGVAIAYTVRGSGPPVYICHGGPGSAPDYLRSDLAPLESHFQLVYHFYRGSGLSDTAPPHTYKFNRLADDLEELRIRLGHGTIRIFAHSMGAFVALNYALRYREHCDRLVLIAATPTGKLRHLAPRSIRALGPARTAEVAWRVLLFFAFWGWRRDSPAHRAREHTLLVATQGDPPAGQISDKGGDRRAPVDSDNSSRLSQEIPRRTIPLVWKI